MFYCLWFSRSSHVLFSLALWELSCSILLGSLGALMFYCPGLSRSSKVLFSLAL